jgi:cytochrome c553
MRCSLFLLVTAFCLGAPIIATLGDDATVMRHGRHLAEECTGCHRIDGTDSGIPPINGWDADRLTATLKSYQTGERNNPVMVSVAKSLDEEQVRALALYYASLPKPPAKK